MKNPLCTAALLLAAVGFASANYDPAIATRAMYYSAVSYCEKSTIDSWNCGEPCSTLGGF